MTSQKEKAKQLYLTQSASAIAKELGVSEATIRRWVKGINKPKSNKYDNLVSVVYPLAIRKQAAEVVDQLEHNLNPNPNKEERIIPARAYKWGKEDVVSVVDDLNDVAY